MTCRLLHDSLWPDTKGSNMYAAVVTEYKKHWWYGIKEVGEAILTAKDPFELAKIISPFENNPRFGVSFYDYTGLTSTVNGYAKPPPPDEYDIHHATPKNEKSWKQTVMELNEAQGPVPF